VYLGIFECRFRSGSPIKRDRPSACGGGGPIHHRCGSMSPQYEPEDEEMPERVGIITGGASGKDVLSEVNMK
jgi:hypothetical protein